MEVFCLCRGDASPYIFPRIGRPHASLYATAIAGDVCAKILRATAAVSTARMHVRFRRTCPLANGV
jgi:hypothetical protein